MKKIGLYDVDGKPVNYPKKKVKFPNFALLKISQYYKSKGYKVEWYNPAWHYTYYKIFASCVFNFSDKTLVTLDMICGGSGFDLVTSLPKKIEKQFPDYSIYPKLDYSVGFTTRGCSRNCKFCIVRQKEGLIHVADDIDKFWNKKHKKLILMDNNIFACGDRFEEVCEQILEANLYVDFNQALDIRLLTEERAKLLKSMKPIQKWRFAFDSIKYEKAFRKGAEMLLKVGTKPIGVLVLVGFEESFDDALKKLYIIFKEYKFQPYVMIYKDFNKGKKAQILNKATFKQYNPMKDWINSLRYIKVDDFKDFNLKIHTAEEIETLF